MADNKQRRYVKDKGMTTVDQIRAVIGAAMSMPAYVMNEGDDAAQKQAVQAGQGNATFMSDTAKNFGSAILQTPAAVPAFVDLARAGVEAVGNTVVNRDTTKSFASDLGSKFIDEIYSPEARAKTDQFVKAKLGQYMSQNEGATQEQATEFLKEFQDSDEFADFVADNMSYGISLGTIANKYANQIVGLDRRPDQQTATDDALQAVGSAFVGLPVALQKALAKNVTKIVGEKVTNSITGRIVARTAEAMSPITMPYNPTNIAINAGAGVGISELSRGLLDEPTLIDYEKVFNPENLPTPEQFAEGTGITLGMIAGLPAAKKAIVEQATKESIKAAEKNIDNIASSTPKTPEQVVDEIGDKNTEKTLKQQSEEANPDDVLTPQLSKVTGAADANAPLQKGANKFGASTEQIDYIGATASNASAVNSIQRINNTLNYGTLDGIGSTVPFVEIERAVNNLSAKDVTRLDRYLFATQRKQDMEIASRKALDAFNEATTARDKALLKGNRAAAAQAQKELNVAATRQAKIANDDPSARSSFNDWSAEDVDNLIAYGDSRQDFKAIYNAFKKVSNDLVRYRVANGTITGEEGARLIRNRNMYFPLQQVDYADDAPLVRAGKIVRDRFKRNLSEEGPQISSARRDVTGEGAVVNKAVSPIMSIRSAIMSAVREVEANKARLNIIDTMRALPGAEGKLLKAYEFKPGVKSVSQAQFQAHFADKLAKSRNDYVRVVRKGNVEMWRFSDPSITKAMQFAPLSTVPVFNETRKMFQQWTTGLGNPFFAPVSAGWDVMVGAITKQEGTSFGLVDGYIQRILGDNTATRTLHSVIAVPDAAISTIAAIPYQLGLRFVRATGQKIAIDLATSSGVFNAMASSGPKGKQFVERVGESMASTFQKSALASMTQNLSTSLSHLNDVSTMSNTYKDLNLPNGGLAGDFVRSTFNAYKALVEIIQMSAKTAYYAENYARLRRKYNGNIPQREIDKLADQTRNLSGDMSRQSNNKAVQLTTSVFPYSMAVINGTRHIMSSAVPNTMRKGVNALGGNMLENNHTSFWTRLMAGAVLPKLGALAILADWEGAEEYYYNLPSWKQMGMIPIPTPEALTIWATTGKLPDFKPEYLNEMRLMPPEFAMIIEPMISGLRTMGVLNKRPNTAFQTEADVFKEVLSQVTGFVTPPLLSAAAAMVGQQIDLHRAVKGEGLFREQMDTAAGGARSDMITHNSAISQTFYNVVGAMLSTGAKMVMDTFNVAEISYRETGSFEKGLRSALDTAKFEAARRMPDIGSNPLYDTTKRYYVSDAAYQYVRRVEKDVGVITGQYTIENDAKGMSERNKQIGLETANKISDPFLKQLALGVRAAMERKGPYKDAGQQYSLLRKTLADAEASRYKFKDQSINTFRNKIVEQQKQLKRAQANELVRIDNLIKQKYGEEWKKRYGEEFSFESLGQQVRKNVR